MAGNVTKIRLLCVLLLFVFLYILVLGRLFYWQVARANDLKAVGQTQSSDKLVIQAKRGEILTSDGFPLATNKISYLLYANPKVVTDIDSYSKQLAPLLEVEGASLSAQLSKNLFWIRLAQKLPDAKKQEVEKLKLSGLGFQEQSERY